MHWLLPFALIVAFVFGTPYAAGVIYGAMGPWEATAIEHDGNPMHMQFGDNLPRPEWVPVYPGAMIVGGSRLMSAKAPSGFHGLELATRASLEEVKRFYTEQLTAAGFAVEDLGTLSLDPMTAAYLGIAGALSAKRAASDDQIDIQIRTADGLIPSRMLQISWRKMSEMPGNLAQMPNKN
jgi:hypothetical protein